MNVAAFKKAMRRLTSTVTLVATEHEGTPYGMAGPAGSSVW
ncbi:flavin reductase domain-containing protein, partial [Pseudomonas amygdali pv. mori str. 301020]